MLQPTPNFGDKNWDHATEVLRKRNLLMHPKTPQDLQISAESWDEIQTGVVWLMKHLFDFWQRLQEKYVRV